MARIKNSPLEGLRGTLGDLVFRTWGGKTFVYQKPEKPKRQSSAQKATRTRFKVAAARAKALLQDDTLRLHYEQEAYRLNLPNAYTAALREQMISAPYLGSGFEEESVRNRMHLNYGHDQSTR